MGGNLLIGKIMKNCVKLMEPGKFYHVYNRACGWKKMFITGDNFEYFLSLYDHYLGEYVNTYAYCLLPNHFHLLIQTKYLQGIKDLGELYNQKFSNFFNSYAKAFNNYFSRKGNLFSQNFKKKEVGTDKYLRTLIIYIHQNPIKHGYAETYDDWEYSSYLEIMGDECTNCQGNKVLEYFHNKKIFEFCHSFDIDIDVE